MSLETYFFENIYVEDFNLAFVNPSTTIDIFFTNWVI